MLNGVARRAGFTLIELTAVIAIMAIIAVVAALVLRNPLRAYDEARGRAELTDAADTALRRIGREVKQALPNSLRLKQVGACAPAPCTTYVEFLQARTGGRYRSSPDGAGAGDVLSFSASDASFDTLGPLSVLAGQAVQANDVLVVFNLNASPSVTDANAYTYNQAAFNCTSATPSSASCNSARIIAPDSAGALAGERHLTIDARQFPYTSPGNRFHIVSGPVTFVCDLPATAVDGNGNGTGTLDRVSGYSIQLAQPGPAYAGAPATGRLANFVSACDFQYDAATSLPAYLATGLLTLRISFTRKNETVTLYQEVHVSNVP